MAILFDGTDFGEAAGNFLFQPLTAPAYEMAEVIHRFWGVSSAAIHYSEQTDRQLAMSVIFKGFASEAALRTHIFNVQAKRGDTGTLQANAVTWPNVAFLGFTPDSGPFWDGSGVNGWVQRGTFAFRQIYPT